MAKGKHCKNVQEKKDSSKSKTVQILSYSMVIILAALLGVGFVVFKNLNDSVKSEDFTSYLNEDRADKENIVYNSVDPNNGRDLNYLIIGSDTREGDENEKLGGGEVDIGRSDTTAIAHISKNRDRVDVVSIPRDSMVKIPSCERSDGSETEENELGMFNSAYSSGDNIGSSVACTAKTVEENTGLFIDGYVMIDFSGLTKLVDALDGIKINVPYDMKSEKAHIDLKKGEQTLNGEQALGFTRARSFEIGPDTGSDTDRIERQHLFLEALVKKLLNNDYMTNPQKIYDISQSALDSVTVSPEIGNIKKLVGFANSLKNIDEQNIKFYTVPFTEWSGDSNRVIWTEKANDYWEYLKQDQPLEEITVTTNQ